MLVVHGLFLAALPGGWRANQSADYETHYSAAAEKLAAGKGYRASDGMPEVRYPPGFPATIAAGWTVGGWFGVSPEASLRWTTALTTALGAAVFHLLARSLLLRTTAWIATALWMTYPPLLWLGKQPNSETPYLPLLFGGLWCAVRMVRRLGEGTGGRGPAAAAGVLFGLATLVRPAALLIAAPVALAGFWALRHEREVRRRTVVLGLALLVACQALVLLPWELWVLRQSGRLVPVSTGARLSVLDGLTVAIKPERQGPWVPEGVRELMWDVQAHRSSIDGPLSAGLFLLDRARDRPLPVVQLVALKAARSWYATDSLRFEGLLALLQIPYLTLALWGLGRGPWRRRDGPDAALPPGDRAVAALKFPLVVCVTLFTWWLTVLVLSILRYMLPAMALLMLPAAHRLEFLLRRRRAGGSSRGA